MSKAIYQKFRPQKFSEVLGHDLIKKVLLNSLKNENLAHAILFTGPRGTGKTSMARLLAKGLNCTNPGKDGDCCGECNVCKQVEVGSYIDMVEIDAASNRGIEEIRILKEKVNFAPADGKYKIYIIDEVHMLTKEAFNALLKTLEEPPSFVVFVLATTEPHKIPMTILSRVQRFDLKLALEDELIQKLEKIAKSEGVKLNKDAAQKIYELSGGSYRDSESLFSKLLNSEIKTDKEISLLDVEEAFGLINAASVAKFARFLLQADSVGALGFSRELLNEGYAVDQLIFQTIEYLRGLIRGVMAGKSQFELSRIVLVLAKLSTAGSELRTAQILSLPLEIAILELGENSQPNAKQISQRTITEESAESSERQGISQSIQKQKKAVKKDEIKTVEEKEKIVQPKIEQNVTGEIPFEKVSADWDALIDATKEHNHHLYAFLSKAKLNSIIKDTILVNVPYKFHKQKIESHSTREILSEIFMDKYGIKLLVKCEVDPDMIEVLEQEEEADDSNENLVEEVFNDL